MLSKGFKIADRYELSRCIGYGGMGEVWEAQDTWLTRDVAVKVIHPHLLGSDPKSASVFVDEARLGAQLIGHPNVVCTLDIPKFDHQGTEWRCLVMENVPGMSLQEWIDKVSTTLDNKTWHYINLLIAFRVCEAIQFSHKRKIQHRDIKPLNIFLSQSGNIKVGDFGIARFIESVTRTHTMWNAMSPAYAAPEQWEGKKPTKNTDIYQLGCTLFQLFTTELPFDETSGPSLMRAHITDVVPEPKIKNKIISDNLSDVIHQCLNKQQTKRPALWKIHDVLSNDVMKKYSIKLDISDKSASLIKRVSVFTELREEALKKGVVHYTYEDYDEALSESIELVIAGITNFSLTISST